MRKLALVLFVSLLVVGCGSKYSDVKKVNEEYVSLMEVYMGDLEKADSAKDVAKAMNRFADKMESLWPKMEKLAEKYPELKDSANPPEELKETQQKAEELGQKMVGAMMKLIPYMADPEVRKAQERMGQNMMQK